MQYSRVVVVAFALIVALAGCHPTNAPTGARVGAAPVARAQEIQAVHLTGEGPKSLAEAKGLVVVVQFWSTYSDACRRSFPKYQELLSEFEGKLAVLAISVDEPEDGAAQQILRFGAETAVRFPLLWDTTGATREAYRPRHLPTSYIIDRHGVVRFVHASYEAGTPQKMATQIASLLSSP
jgi:peroxiredoxin